ncbi:uncharacterized protein L3040_001614 [Drepanopeziza brunnea f. sp. 'multigermtubi']|uniref:uncharacterized protein n=1 Tax=Drepanopeziza brunnea f. sp. 'multigermtubi' TaxID=698441 RepID=UPI002396C1C7|nr:hypothetical protein L3040_001614 [Drepanopeziza brunnea f. sp. 'multigermtubi']
MTPSTPNPPSAPPPTLPLPASFLAKKALIHAQLTAPSPGGDLSPKGSVDEQIRPLIDEVNARAGCVTTSSCAGRISVFFEGRRKAVAAGGGKGAGGRWLFVSHDPVDVAAGCAGEETWARRLGMQRLRSEGQEQEQEQEQEALQRAMGNVTGKTRLVHFKFEPMILHVLTASLAHAQTVLSAALQAGFRESGALNLTSSSSSSSSSSSAAEPPTPMVGIRSMGLALESVVGFESAGRVYCMVPEWQLRTLLEISNQRFVENAKRIERFRSLLKEMSGDGSREEKRKGQDGAEWEDAGARRERKRKEGLERAEEMRKAGQAKKDSGLAGDGLDLGILDGNT